MLLLRALKKRYWDIQYGPKRWFFYGKEGPFRTLEIIGFKWQWAQRHISRFEKIHHFLKYKDICSEEDKRYYLENLYKQSFGFPPNLDNPQTFNEKLNWMKLYYHPPLMTQCADKYAGRDYVAEKVGEQYLVPLLGVYDSAKEIKLDKLPEQFVLKVNWGSSRNIICRNKAELDWTECREKLTAWLKPTANHYYPFLEWGYKNIPPKIVCETYLKELEQSPKVYKIMCFDGEPKIIQLVLNDKTAEETINYYDTDWTLLPIRQNYPNEPTIQERPVLLEEMFWIARQLSKPFPMVRVDLFEIKNQIFFSEMTFYSDAALVPFIPPEWDLRLGNLITLPEKWL